MHDKFLDQLRLSIPYSKRLAGSSKGWLVIVAGNYSVRLYKPYYIDIEGDSIMEDGSTDANIKIELPRLFLPVNILDLITIYDYHVVKALITADPLANPNDCIIAVIFGEFWEIAFLRYARDTTWTKVKVNTILDNRFHDITYYNNQIYAVNQLG